MGKYSWVHTVEPIQPQEAQGTLPKFLRMITKPTLGAPMFQVIFQTLLNSVTPASMNW